MLRLSVAYLPVDKGKAHLWATLFVLLPRPLFSFATATITTILTVTVVNMYLKPKPLVRWTNSLPLHHHWTSLLMKTRNLIDCSMLHRLLTSAVDEDCDTSIIFHFPYCTYPHYFFFVLTVVLMAVIRTRLSDQRWRTQSFMATRRPEP